MIGQFTVRELCAGLRDGSFSATNVVRDALQAGRKPALGRTYLSFNQHALAEAEKLDHGGPPKKSRTRPLHGIPISVKDLFDVRGLPTTCGSSFYESTRPLPRTDSPYVAAWKKTGAIVIGKTHLNEFAYGLTGENLWSGPLAQPDHPSRLTGGSSSGAAASIQGNAASLGLGTDTGGSLRVPSALCGLVGYRQSYKRHSAGDAFPLAPSFDTHGWIQRHLSDFSFVYRAFMGRNAITPHSVWRVAFLKGNWLSGCTDEILSAQAEWAQSLTSHGVQVRWLAPKTFTRAPETFIALQAAEAGKIHRRFLQRKAYAYDPTIRARMEMGLRLTPAQISAHRARRAILVEAIAALFVQNDLLICPAVPCSELRIGEDHSARRRDLLQLTTPFSLAGLPVLTVPIKSRNKVFGYQIVAPHLQDDRLAAFADYLLQQGCC